MDIVLGGSETIQIQEYHLGQYFEQLFKTYREEWIIIWHKKNAVLVGHMNRHWAEVDHNEDSSTSLLAKP